MTSSNIDRYINLAIVGHVSNGKTTLVNALTGVDTKRDSSEKKSGRTIKLGYANCMLWKCSRCHLYAVSGQDTKDMSCEICDVLVDIGGAMDIIHKISFVDAPGHHEYVQTMTRGTAVVDGALIVTDVRMKDLQAQTIEHLAILDILGIGNIVIVQNKIDLVSNEQRREHYKMLKNELHQTLAEDAAIIPISAQSRVGIYELLPWLDELCRVAKAKPVTARKVFSVIRSFDINKPGTPDDELKGGVLGGSVLGDTKFSIGDVLEVRPGGRSIVIESIQSENDKCDSISMGGLYGIGTDLSPDLTRADKLIGSLCGKEEDLPKVVGELLLNITYVLLKSYQDKIKIVHHYKYQLILGSHTITATAKKITGNTWKFILDRPICTVETTCLIYTIKPSVLIGFGRMEGYLPPSPSSYTMPLQSKSEYEEILSKISVDDTEKKKSSVPVPKLARENRNVIWTNILEFCTRIRRSKEAVSKYVADETLIPVSMCDNGLRMYKAAINERKLSSILKKFIIEKVSCKQCKSIDTEDGKCLTCSAVMREE